MSTVLWGGRRGDVHYNSRGYWRRNIPIDPAVSRVAVECSHYFDVGVAVESRHEFSLETGSPVVHVIAGIEGGTLGVRTTA